MTQAKTLGQQESSSSRQSGIVEASTNASEHPVSQAKSERSEINEFRSSSQNHQVDSPKFPSYSPIDVKYLSKESERDYFDTDSRPSETSEIKQSIDSPKSPKTHHSRASPKSSNRPSRTPSKSPHNFQTSVEPSQNHRKSELNEHNPAMSNVVLTESEHYKTVDEVSDNLQSRNSLKSADSRYSSNRNSKASIKGSEKIYADEECILSETPMIVSLASNSRVSKKDYEAGVNYSDEFESDNTADIDETPLSKTPKNINCIIITPVSPSENPSHTSSKTTTPALKSQGKSRSKASKTKNSETGSVTPTNAQMPIKSADHQQDSATIEITGTQIVSQTLEVKGHSFMSEQLQVLGSGIGKFSRDGTPKSLSETSSKNKDVSAVSPVLNTCHSTTSPTATVQRAVSTITPQRNSETDAISSLDDDMLIIKHVDQNEKIEQLSPFSSCRSKTPSEKSERRSPSLKSANSISLGQLENKDLQNDLNNLLLNADSSNIKEEKELSVHSAMSRSSHISDDKAKSRQSSHYSSQTSASKTNCDRGSHQSSSVSVKSSASINYSEQMSENSRKSSRHSSTSSGSSQQSNQSRNSSRLSNRSENKSEQSQGCRKTSLSGGPEESLIVAKINNNALGSDCSTPKEHDSHSLHRCEDTSEIETEKCVYNKSAASSVLNGSIVDVEVDSKASSKHSIIGEKSAHSSSYTSSHYSEHDLSERHSTRSESVDAKSTYSIASTQNHDSDENDDRKSLHSISDATKVDVPVEVLSVNSLEKVDGKLDAISIKSHCSEHSTSASFQQSLKDSESNTDHDDSQIGHAQFKHSEPSSKISMHVPGDSEQCDSSISKSRNSYTITRKKSSHSIKSSCTENGREHNKKSSAISGVDKSSALRHSRHSMRISPSKHSPYSSPTSKKSSTASLSARKSREGDCIKLNMNMSLSSSPVKDSQSIDKGHKCRRNSSQSSKASLSARKSREGDSIKLNMNLSSSPAKDSQSNDKEDKSLSSSRNSSIISPVIIKSNGSPQNNLSGSTKLVNYKSSASPASVSSRQSQRTLNKRLSNGEYKMTPNSRLTSSRESAASSSTGRSLKSKTEYIEEKKYLRSLQGNASDIELTSKSLKSGSTSSRTLTPHGASKKSSTSTLKPSSASDLCKTSSESEAEEVYKTDKKSAGSHLSIPIRSKSRSKPLGMVGFELNDECDHISSSSGSNEIIVAGAGRLSKSSKTPLAVPSYSRPTSSNKSRIISAQEYAKYSSEPSTVKSNADRNKYDSSDHYSDVFSSDEREKSAAGSRHTSSKLSKKLSAYRKSDSDTAQKSKTLLDAESPTKSEDEELLNLEEQIVQLDRLSHHSRKSSSGSNKFDSGSTRNESADKSSHDSLFEAEAAKSSDEKPNVVLVPSIVSSRAISRKDKSAMESSVLKHDYSLSDSDFERASAGASRASSKYSKESTLSVSKRPIDSSVSKHSEASVSKHLSSRASSKSQGKVSRTPSLKSQSRKSYASINEFESDSNSSSSSVKHPAAKGISRQSVSRGSVTSHGYSSASLRSRSSNSGPESSKYSSNEESETNEGPCSPMPVSPLSSRKSTGKKSTEILKDNSASSVHQSLPRINYIAKVEPAKKQSKVVLTASLAAIIQQRILRPLPVPISRESTSIKALELIREKLRMARQKSRGRSATSGASLAPYCATNYVFDLINQPERADTGVFQSRPTVLELLGVSGSLESSKMIPMTKPLPPFPRLGAVVRFKSQVRGKIDYNDISRMRKQITQEHGEIRRSRKKAQNEIKHRSWQRFQLNRIPSDMSTSHFLRAVSSYLPSSQSRDPHRAMFT